MAIPLTGVGERVGFYHRCTLYSETHVFAKTHLNWAENPALYSIHRASVLEMTMDQPSHVLNWSTQKLWLKRIFQDITTFTLYADFWTQPPSCSSTRFLSNTFHHPNYVVLKLQWYIYNHLAITWGPFWRVWCRQPAVSVGEPPLYVADSLGKNKFNVSYRSLLDSVLPKSLLYRLFSDLALILFRKCAFLQMGRHSGQTLGQ